MRESNSSLLNFGQVSWLLWPMVTGAWILARKERWSLGAVLVGVVMM